MKNPNKGGVYADCWHIPGGGIEEGEDKIKALKREISEEVGIDISLFKIDLIDNKGKGVSTKKLKNGKEVKCYMQFNVYKVDIPLASKMVKVNLTDDLEKCLWLDLKKVGDYKLTPPSVQLFKRLGWLSSKPL